MGFTLKLKFKYLYTILKEEYILENNILFIKYCLIKKWKIKRRYLNDKLKNYNIVIL